MGDLVYDCGEISQINSGFYFVWSVSGCDMLGRLAIS
jgi:hypothetical protein